MLKQSNTIFYLSPMNRKQIQVNQRTETQLYLLLNQVIKQSNEDILQDKWVLLEINIFIFLTVCFHIIFTTLDMLDKINQSHRISEQYRSRGIRDGCTRQELKNYLQLTYFLHESLFALIKQNEAYYLRPEPLRHPLIFYYGHTGSFYINKLIDQRIITSRVDPKMEAMMAVGVDEMKWDDLNEEHYKWPNVDEVREFRRKVNQKLEQVIDTIDMKLSWTSDLWVLMMGIEHQRVHIQTSAAIIRRLDPKYICPSPIYIDCPLYTTDPQKIPINRLLPVPAIEFEWNKNLQNANSYGWDNEFGEKKFTVEEFSASEMLTSNGEFLEFVRQGGYENMQFWDEEGREWLKETGVNHPIYWIKAEGGYLLRTMNKVFPLPLNWPAQVNNLEASAFCLWKSQKTGVKVRLPTEAQCYSMHRNFVTPEHEGKWNKDLMYWFSPCPVNTFKFGAFYDVTGNLWQHTKTNIYMLDKSQPHPLYEDYTIPSCDGKHKMLIGNSFMSIGAYSSYEVRNTFRRHFYQSAGFRYVLMSPSDEKEEGILQKKLCEEKMDKLVGEKIRFQFSEESNYLKTVLKIVEEMTEKEKKKVKKSLVIGCCIGRLVLQLSRFAAKSVGIDYVVRYFSISEKLLDKGSLDLQGKNKQLADYCCDPMAVEFIQMNPENPDPHKVNGCDLLIVDGSMIRPGTMEAVVTQSQKMTTKEGEMTYILINKEGRNFMDKEQVHKCLPGSFLVCETECEVSESCKDPLLLSIYRVSGVNPQ